MNKATAILLFSRSARAEAALKRYGSEGAADLRIATALIARTRRTLAHSGLPVFEVDERRQHGMDFGQRLAHAVSGVFARGYASVIVVGNDCPTLTASHLRRTAAALADGRQVMGRDQRGGAWIIGLQRAGFNAESFGSLRWQCAELHHDLRTFLGPVLQLAVLRDINRISDLRVQWKQLRSRLTTLAFIICPGDVNQHVAASIPDGAERPRLRGRAPPVAA